MTLFKVEVCMLYENSKEQSEHDSFIADSSAEHSPLGGTAFATDIHEEDLLAQEFERLSNIIDIDEDDDFINSTPGTSTRNPWHLSTMIKSLIAICGVGAVGGFIYNLFNRSPQRMDFLSTLSPVAREQARDLIENITQFHSMNSTTAVGTMTTKETLLRALMDSSITGYPTEYDRIEQFPNSQAVTISKPYAFLTSTAKPIKQPTQPPIMKTSRSVDIQQKDLSADAIEFSSPMLDKQEMDDIYQREQIYHRPQKRSITNIPGATKSTGNSISYEMAINTLFLDHLPTENHASYQTFLKVYTDDFFHHYNEYNSQSLNLSVLTIHLYNVFNEIFIKEILSKPAEMSRSIFFALHTLLNLSLALKNTPDLDHSSIKIIDFWNENEINSTSFYKYLNWMSPLPSNPLEEKLYSKIVTPQNNEIDKINIHNVYNRIKRIPKIIERNTETINNIQSVLHTRKNVKNLGLNPNLPFGMTKLHGQPTDFLIKNKQDLTQENKTLGIELKNLNKHATQTKTSYPSTKLENLQKIKSELNNIYHSRLTKETEKNPVSAINIHDRMANLIPSMILEIGVNQRLSRPIENTIKISFETDALDFAKQYFYSLHQDSIYYDYALEALKTSSFKTPSRLNNHVDISTAQRYARKVIEKEVKNDFSLFSSPEIEEKMTDLFIEGNDYYSRLYLITAATIYKCIRDNRTPSTLDHINPHVVIDSYLEDSYRQDKIRKQRRQPDNFTSLGELKSNLHFATQQEYNKQFSDYKGPSSLFEAETIARNLIDTPEMININAIQDIEWLYYPPAEVNHYQFTSSSGGLTAIKLQTEDWLVISSYNGNFAAEFFKDGSGGSFDAMLSLLKKPKEMKGKVLLDQMTHMPVKGSEYRPSNRFYPDVNLKKQAEQNNIDKFLSKIHKTTIKNSALTINLNKNIRTPDSTSTYEIIIEALNKDLQSHADALKNTLDYSGLAHKIATYVIPFYSVIYKSATDEKYNIDTDDIIDIVFDSIEVATIVVSTGVSLSSSISKAIVTSTARLSKSGLTKQALRRAVLKELITTKIISKKSLSGTLHFIDDIINPVPYKSTFNLISSRNEKIGKRLSKETLSSDFILRGGGDFCFGLKRHIIEKREWNKFKITTPRNLIKTDTHGMFKDIYSSKNHPGKYFIKNKNDCFEVKYDDVFETWRVQSPDHPNSYQHAFSVEKKGDKWTRLHPTSLSTSTQKHHIKIDDVFTDTVVKKLDENQIKKSVIKSQPHQLNEPGKDFLYFNDEMDMYIRKNSNEYYDFEYTSPEQDIAFIGKRGEKRLVVIYNRNEHKFDLVKSYWDNGNEVIIKGSDGNIAKTLGYNRESKLYTLRTDSEDIILEYDVINNSLRKSHVTGATKLEGNVWRKEYDDFFIYEGSSKNSRLVIDGHGGETDTYLTSEFNIPEGSQLNFYAPHGKMLQAPENALEDFVKNKFEYAQTLNSVHKSPDYILTFYEDPVSFREIAMSNKANIVQIKSGQSVRLSEVIKKVSETTGINYDQFDIAVCRPRSGMGSFFPSKIYKAKMKNG